MDGEFTDMNSDTYKIVDGEKIYVDVGDRDQPSYRESEGRITDPRLPHRFGNRKQRRKMQSEIRKIK